MEYRDQLKQSDADYLVNCYSRFDVVIETGKNATCYDFNGKEYIDFSSGIGVNSLGYCDEGWVNAVTQQAKKLQHCSNLYYTEPGVKAAKLLCEKTGYSKVFFANSGAEANECAIKAARKYSYDKYGEGRNEIITLNNSFHGRTVTTLTATGQDHFHQYFFPFTGGFTYTNPTLEETLAAISPKTCAVLVELIQGEGGVIPLEMEYVKTIYKVCQENDILFMVDEVQTGAGRTGKLFCFEHYGIIPDVVTSAKGIGGGLPIGVVLFHHKTQSVLGYGDHGTTFGGNPLATAAMTEVLNRLDDALLTDVLQKGEYLKNKLEALPLIKSVTGKGLMLGAELDGVPAAEVVKEGIQQGVIVLTAKSKLRFLPPLTITMPELNQGLDCLEKALIKIQSNSTPK